MESLGSFVIESPQSVKRFDVTVGAGCAGIGDGHSILNCVAGEVTCWALSQEWRKELGGVLVIGKGEALSSELLLCGVSSE